MGTHLGSESVLTIQVPPDFDLTHGELMSPTDQVNERRTSQSPQLWTDRGAPHLVTGLEDARVVCRKRLRGHRLSPPGRSSPDLALDLLCEGSHLMVSS